MWICSKLGFYSIIEKRGPCLAYERSIHVRARSKEDLVRLLAKANLTSRLPIRESEHTDYKWRVVVAKNSGEWDRIWEALGGTIDYPNFKSEIYSLPDQVDKRQAYSAFWASMQRLQR